MYFDGFVSRIQAEKACLSNIVFFLLEFPSSYLQVQDFRWVWNASAVVADSQFLWEVCLDQSKHLVLLDTIIELSLNCLNLSTPTIGLKITRHARFFFDSITPK